MNTNIINANKEAMLSFALKIDTMLTTTTLAFVTNNLELSKELILKEQEYNQLFITIQKNYTHISESALSSEHLHIASVFMKASLSLKLIHHILLNICRQITLNLVSDDLKNIFVKEIYSINTNLSVLLKASIDALLQLDSKLASHNCNLKKLRTNKKNIDNYITNLLSDKTISLEGLSHLYAVILMLFQIETHLIEINSHIMELNYHFI